MKATLISKENDIANFTMQFTAEEVEAATIKAYQKNKDNFSIDGFRKGKAPRSVIEKQYGETIFVEDAINLLFNEEYIKAIEELELQVVEGPAVDFDKFEKGKDFKCNVKVPVFPEFEVEGYKDLELEKIKVSVTEADVEDELKKIQARNARMTSVEREAKDGDTVTLDYKGFVGEKQFDGGTAEKFPLKLGSNSFIPGFEEQLIGVKV
ncbi:MAG: trigger factor, partial [Anaerovoracaceae bacterium]